MRRASVILAVFIYLALIFCSLSCKTINKNSKPAVEKLNIYEKRILSQQEKVNLEETIAIFTKEIGSKPQYSGAYYNRAIAYYFNKDYDKSWQDVCKAQRLGAKFKPEFIEALRKASGSNR